MNFQQALTDRQAEKAAQVEAEWPAFVIGLDRAKTAPDPDSMLSSLDRFGKSPDELQAALDRLRERRRLAGLVADVPRHREEYAKHHAELNEEIERFAPLLKSHENLVWELRSSRSYSQAGERDGGQAERELRDTCSPTLRAAIQGAVRVLAELDERVREYGYEVERIGSDVARIASEPHQSPEAVAENRQRTAALEDKSDRLKQASDALAAQRPGLVEELAKLREESLSAESI